MPLNYEKGIKCKEHMLEKNIDLTKGQGTSVEGGRESPTSSEYTSTCSKKKGKKVKYLEEECQKDLLN